MKMRKKIPCPECRRIMSEFGPEQNDWEGPPIKRIKMKCESCSPLGRIWEVKIDSGIVVEIKFLRALFRDFDHR